MPRIVSPASSTSPEVSAALCLPVCEMGGGAPSLEVGGIDAFPEKRSFPQI